MLSTHKVQERQQQQEMFGGDGRVYYVDCGDGNIGVCICPNSSYCVH